MSQKPITVKELNTRVEKLAETFYRDLNQFKDQFINKDLLNSAKLSEISEENEKDDLIRRFESFEAGINKSIENLKKDVKVINVNLNNYSVELDIHMQHFNNNKLLLHGVKESSNEDIYKNIIDLLRDNIGIEISKCELVNCYRLGKKQPDKNRPIVIEFLQKWQRDHIFFKKKQLKGKNVLISEVLTKYRYKIFQECYKIYKNLCWTRNGIIIVLKNGQNTYISTMEQMTTFLNK